LVVRKDGGYSALSDILVDIRVDDHEQPLAELRRIYKLHNELFGATPADEWIAVDADLAAELTERLAHLGFEGDLAETLPRWAGNANFEERIDGAERIDPIVLEALRNA